MLIGIGHITAGRKTRWCETRFWEADEPDEEVKKIVMCDVKDPLAFFRKTGMPSNSSDERLDRIWSFIDGLPDEG